MDYRKLTVLMATLVIALVLGLSASSFAQDFYKGKTFRILVGLPPGHPDLLETQLFEEPYMFFCREEHPLSRMKSITWSDLREAELIVISSLSANRVFLDYQLAKRGISIRGAYEVQHLSTAIGLVAAGVGTAILPSSTLEDGARPNGSPGRERVFSQFASQAWCNQEDAGRLKQGLDDEAETVIAQGQALVLQDALLRSTGHRRRPRPEPEGRPRSGRRGSTPNARRSSRWRSASSPLLANTTRVNAK